MQTLVVVIHLMVIIALVGVVLLQKSEGGGLGVGSTGGFLSSRGTSNVLTRTTAILAGMFFATSLLLSVLAGWERKPHSIIQGETPAQPQGPSAPSAPLGQGGGLSGTLRQNEQSPAPTPGAPAPAPAVPRSQ